MGMITEAKFEKATREVKSVLRGKSDAYVIEPNGSHWHPAVTVSKQSLRILLEVSKKARVM